MSRLTFLTLVLTAAISHSAFAQVPKGAYQWKPGQMLIYQEEQATKIDETRDGRKQSSSNSLKLTKKWHVTQFVKGVATMELSLASLRLESTLVDGRKLLYDSEQPQNSDPQLRQQLSRYVGITLAEIQVDTTGKLIAVKQAKHGPASRFETEHPFVCQFPAAPIQAGSKWKRAYNITLEPPQGTGEKYPTEQHFTCTSLKAGQAEITFTTEVKELPKALRDQIPLLQLQPTGKILFDVTNGQMLKAEHTVTKTLKGHEGAGTEYHYEHRFKSQLLSATRKK